MQKTLKTTSGKITHYCTVKWRWFNDVQYSICQYIIYVAQYTYNVILFNAHCHAIATNEEFKSLWIILQHLNKIRDT